MAKRLSREREMTIQNTVQGARRLLVLVTLGVVCLAQQAAAPVVEEAVAPDYPAAAVQAGAGGTVAVEARVSERGTVVSATAVEGHALLRQASVEAARLWRFAAQPAAGAVRLSFSFRLMPKDTPQAQLGAVFRPPYTVEVRKTAAEKVTHYARGGSQRAPGDRPGRDRPPG